MSRALLSTRIMVRPHPVHSFERRIPTLFCVGVQAVVPERHGGVGGRGVVGPAAPCLSNCVCNRRAGADSDHSQGNSANGGTANADSRAEPTARNIGHLVFLVIWGVFELFAVNELVIGSDFIQSRRRGHAPSLFILAAPSFLAFGPPQLPVRMPNPAIVRHSGRGIAS